MPPAIENSRLSAFAPALSTVTDPTPRADGTLKAKALEEPTYGWPRRLNSTRSLALASVTVPTVDRALAPTRS